jgi:hypothetical protein
MSNTDHLGRSAFGVHRSEFGVRRSPFAVRGSRFAVHREERKRDMKSERGTGQISKVHPLESAFWTGAAGIQGRAVCPDPLWTRISNAVDPFCPRRDLRNNNYLDTWHDRRRTGYSTADFIGIPLVSSPAMIMRVRATEIRRPMESGSKDPVLVRCKSGTGTLDVVAKFRGALPRDTFGLAIEYVAACFAKEAPPKTTSCPSSDRPNKREKSDAQI